MALIKFTINGAVELFDSSYLGLVPDSPGDYSIQYRYHLFRI